MTRLGYLEIQVLGPVRVLRSGTEISVGGPVDRAVLATLAIEAGERVAVNDLLDIAYAGISKHSAKRALQTAIWRLRRSLDGDGSRIVTDRDGYRLEIDPAAVDAGSLRLALATAAHACRDARPSDAVAVLSKAAARWRGRAPELPASVTDDLEDLVCDAISGLAALLLDADRPDDALQHIRRLLAEHPDHPQANLLAEEAARRRGLLSTTGGRPAPARPEAGVLSPGELMVGTERAVRAVDIAGLVKPARTIVRLVAVAARCTLAELRAAVGLWFDEHGRELSPDASTIVDTLVDGTQSGVLTMTGSPMDTVAVVSGDVARHALDGVDPSTILAMNGVVANAIRQVHGDDLGPHLVRTAEHLVRGIPVIDPPVAIDALQKAADYALIAEPDSDTARDLLVQALDLHRSWIPGVHERRLDLLLQLGRAQEKRGDSAAANDVWEEVAELATAHDLPSRLAEAALELAGSIWKPRDHAGSADMLERAGSLLPPESEMRALIMLRRVQIERYAPDDAWMSRTTAATDRLLLAGLPGEDAAARASFALAMWASRIEKGTGTFDDDPELVRLVSAAADSPALGLMRDRWQITRAMVQGRFVVAEQRLADLATRLPALGAGATTGMERDEFDVARFTSAMQLAAIRMYQGRAAEARSVIEAIRLDGRLPKPPTRENLDERALSALILARSGERRRASVLLQRVLADLWGRPAGQVRYATAINSAFVVADLGDVDSARLLVAELEPQRGRHCIIGQSGYAGVTEHALGRLHAAQGNLDEADDLLGTAVSDHVRVGADVFASLSRYWRADVLRRLDGPSCAAEADELLVEVERANLRFRADNPAA